MKKGVLFGLVASVPVWVAIAAVAKADWWLACICLAAAVVTTLMWVAPDGAVGPAPSEPAQPYLDQFEVLRREAREGRL